MLDSEFDVLRRLVDATRQYVETEDDDPLTEGWV